MNESRRLQPVLRCKAVLGVAFGMALLTACSPGDAHWEKNPHPPYQNVTPHPSLQGESNFAKLILRSSQVQPKQAPWAGYWWPFLENGTSQALAQYESATGQRGAASWELAHHGATPQTLNWWGHCNGWSAAAVLFPEPNQPIIRSGISFSVGDQKALLSEIAMEVNADFFGNRVDTPGDTSSPAFMDVYPDQFFLVLTNLLPRGLPLIIDRYTGDQVWNQPVAGYQIDPVTPEDSLGSDPSAPGVYRVQVTLTVWWAKDDVAPDWVTEPFTFQDGSSYEHRVLTGEIWLDAPTEFDSSGNLISSGDVILTPQSSPGAQPGSPKQTIVTGGSWQNSDLPPENSHPDYIWVPYHVTSPTGFANPKLDPSQVAAFVENSGSE